MFCVYLEYEICYVYMYVDYERTYDLCMNNVWKSRVIKYKEGMKLSDYDWNTSI
jgi:hypothetical protein